MERNEPVEMIGSSPAFQAVQRAARLIAATDATTLILGESGVGKELFALALHQGSRQAQGPFVPVNCAALSESLAESELFGHVRGSFTGAVKERVGRITAAHGGTLFLDEIGDLPLSIQAKLLRFLETGECQVLGKERPNHVDVRVVLATHRDLARMVGEGRFRKDLFYRLHVAVLHVPPLRERGEDVILLAQAFLAHFAHRLKKRTPEITNSALDLLKQHDWPGNIRELRNLCERSVIFHGENALDGDFVRGQLAAMHGLLQGTDFSSCSHGKALDVSDFCMPHGGISLVALEKELIQEALNRTNGNRTRAAKLLDLTRDALLYRMKKHSLR